MVGVKSDLLAIAQAERMYLASHGSYASVDELQQDGSITFSGANRRGYSYTAEVDDGQHFKITARPATPPKPLAESFHRRNDAGDAGIEKTSLVLCPWSVVSSQSSIFSNQSALIARFSHGPLPTTGD